MWGTVSGWRRLTIWLSTYDADWCCVLWWPIKTPSPKLRLTVVLLHCMSMMYKTASVVLNCRILLKLKHILWTLHGVSRYMNSQLRFVVKINNQFKCVIAFDGKLIWAAQNGMLVCDYINFRKKQALILKFNEGKFVRFLKFHCTLQLSALLMFNVVPKSLS